MNGDQMPRSYFAHGQADLNLRILCMSKDTFSLDMADLKYSRTSLSRTRLFRITAYLEVKIWSLF